MRCPSCGFDNLIGSDVCDNCGADLAGRDVPEAATSYRGPLLREHLDELLHELNLGQPDLLDASVHRDLNVGQPAVLESSPDVDTAVQLMHSKGSDCVLVVEDGRLVGIFTDRDAVLQVARPAAAAPPLA